jgi:hypothetical protein
MPFYVYRYETEEGVQHTERFFRMNQAPDEIIVEEGDAIYHAQKIIALTARMSSNWEVKGTATDLPPENAPVKE